jgi:thiamine-phosphate pyrophosphorylase
MKLKLDQLSLYLVMGTQNCLNSPELVLEEAIKGGITIFQYREKGENALEGIAKYELAKTLQDICRKHQIPFIVNDDVELALELNADGIHVGQEDGNLEGIREQIGNKILGISAHNLEEARQAVRIGADYLGVGPMFPTMTKSDLREVRGPIVIEEIRKSSIELPIVGIGGINEDNLRYVMDAGANGIAVIAAITKQNDPLEATKRLKQKMMNKV